MREIESSGSWTWIIAAGERGGEYSTPTNLYYFSFGMTRSRRDEIEIDCRACCWRHLETPQAVQFSGRIDTEVEYGRLLKVEMTEGGYCFATGACNPCRHRTSRAAQTAIDIELLD